MYSLNSDLPVLGAVLDLLDSKNLLDYSLLLRENEDGDFVLSLEEALCAPAE